MNTKRLLLFVIVNICITIGCYGEHLPETVRQRNPFGKTVCEGRKWDYVVDKVDPQEFYTRLLEGYRFTGIRQVSERSYAVFCDPQGTPLALMREEDRKVYLYVPGPDEKELPGYGISLVKEDLEEVTGEVMLYDFSLRVGDRFKSPCFPDTGDLTNAMINEFEVTSATTHEIRGVSYTTLEVECITFPAYKSYAIVEGAGNLDGLLPFPQMANYTSGIYHTYYNLYKAEDEDGTVLYVSPDGPPVGIDATPDPVDAAATLHGLDGMPVKEAQTGKIYIREGKKVLVK